MPLTQAQIDALKATAAELNVEVAALVPDTVTPPPPPPPPPPPNPSVQPTGPYFAPVAPAELDTGERNEYNRLPVCLHVYKNPVVWTWGFQAGVQDPLPRARFVLDRLTKGPWVTPVNGLYPFDLGTVSNAHHHFGVEFEAGGIIFKDTAGSTWSYTTDKIRVLEKGFIVNTTGIPLPVQAPYTSTDRFEFNYGALGAGSVQVLYPGLPTFGSPASLKPRVPTQFNTRLKQSEMYTRRIQMNIGVNNVRRFVAVPCKDLDDPLVACDVDIEPDQKYFNPAYDSEDYFTRAPKHTLMDGLKGKGTLGYGYGTVICPQNSVFYMVDVLGRLTSCNLTTGLVTTLAGWRNVPGKLKIHSGLHSKYPKLYDSRYEYVGKFTGAVKRFNKPWGLLGFMDPRGPGMHEFIIADTMNYTLRYVNSLPTLPVASYRLPLHPPTGYVAPASATGIAEVVDFLTPAMLGYVTEGPMLDEPFGVALHPITGRVWWTNYGSGTVCSANSDGSNAKIEYGTAHNASDAELQISQHEFNSALTSAQVRTQFVKDGPPGTFTINRPQGIDFDAQGTPFWAERYSFIIRRGNPDGSVTTLCNLPSTGGFSFGSFDVNLVIDRDGTFGPAGDIFTAGFNIQDWRFSKDGVLVDKDVYPQYGHAFENFYAAAEFNGPLSHSRTPGYAWGLAVSQGRAIYQGNAAGWQIYDVTKREATDGPDVDITLYMQGLNAYQFDTIPPMAMTHGPVGQGELGFPTVDDLGKKTDAEIAGYAAPWIKPTNMAAFTYWIRRMCASNA